MKEPYWTTDVCDHHPNDYIAGVWINGYVVDLYRCTTLINGHHENDVCMRWGPEDENVVLSKIIKEKEKE